MWIYCTDRPAPVLAMDSTFVMGPVRFPFLSIPCRQATKQVFNGSQTPMKSSRFCRLAGGTGIGLTRFFLLHLHWRYIHNRLLDTTRSALHGVDVVPSFSY